MMANEITHCGDIVDMRQMLACFVGRGRDADTVIIRRSIAISYQNDVVIRMKVHAAASCSFRVTDFDETIEMSSPLDTNVSSSTVVFTIQL